MKVVFVPCMSLGVGTPLQVPKWFIDSRSAKSLQIQSQIRNQRHPVQSQVIILRLQHLQKHTQQQHNSIASIMGNVACCACIEQGQVGFVEKVG